MPERRVGEEEFASLVEAALPADVWTIDPYPADNPVWIRARHARGCLPNQGWKLHVSATPACASRVLTSCVPVLRDLGVSFKLARDRRTLLRLNSGGVGLSQVGKFITAYPANTDRAVSCASALDLATRRLAGPRVLSDKPLHPGSLVHYRYGVFREDEKGPPEIVGPAGQRVPDARQPRYEQPLWVTNPFPCSSVDGTSLAGRYWAFQLLHQGPRGEVHLGADLATCKARVLKRAYGDGAVDPWGRDAVTRLWHEALVLRELDGLEGHVPKMLDVIADGRDEVMILDDLGLPPLRDEPLDALRTEQVRLWSLRLAELMVELHDAGVIFRDLSPGNVLGSPAGNKCALVDFEMSMRLGGRCPPHGVGTPGFISPQASRGEPPSAADDIFGFGALLALVLGGADEKGKPDELRCALRDLSRACMREDADLRPRSFSQGVLPFLRGTSDHSRRRSDWRLWPGTRRES